MHIWIPSYSYCYVCSVLYILFSLCQLALFGYPDRGFSVLFPQLKGKCQGITSKHGARPAPFQTFCVVLYIVCSVSFCVLFACKCVLYYGHRVATQLQLTYQSLSIHSHSHDEGVLSELLTQPYNWPQKYFIKIFRRVRGDQEDKWNPLRPEPIVKE